MGCWTQNALGLTGASSQRSLAPFLDSLAGNSYPSLNIRSFSSLSEQALLQCYFRTEHILDILLRGIFAF